METIEILKTLIKETLPSNDINWEMENIESLFNDLWFKIEKRYTINATNWNRIPHFLLSIWEWTKTIWIITHYDVVNYWNEWNTIPNEPITRDWYIYWRWASDMLSWLAASLNAAFKSKDKLKFKIFVVWDEETESEWIIKLSEICWKLDYIIWCEPTANKNAWDAIKIWRRWKVWWRIIIKWNSIHVAYVWTDNWINIPNLVINWHFSILTKDYDDWAWLMPKTTFAINEIKSEYIWSNTVPWIITIWFDARISAKYNKESFMEELEKRLDKLCIVHELIIDSYFSPYFTEDSDFIFKITNSISKISRWSVDINCAWWTSDCRYFAWKWIPIVEIWVENSTIHKPNERVSLEGLEVIEKIYCQIFEDLK